MMSIFFCVALDIIIYPSPRIHPPPARMPGVYAKRLYARTHTSGRTKSVQDAPTTNDHDCTDAKPTKHTQPVTGERGQFGMDAEIRTHQALSMDAYKWSNKVGAGRTDNKRPLLHRGKAIRVS